MTQRHFELAEGAHALELDHGLHDAGHGVSYTFWYHDAEHRQPGGIYWWHGCPRIGPDDGPPYTGPDRPGEAKWPPWELISADPLTIGGSLLCPPCGRHGFIRNGRWEPC